MKFEKNIHPLAVLVVCQALWISAGAIILGLSGIVGDQLSSTSMLATLPFALMLVSSAISSAPASWLMYRKGRRAGFFVGGLFGCLSGVVSACALYYESFLLFCVGLVLWGVTWAFAQFLRYAASGRSVPRRRVERFQPFSPEASLEFWQGQASPYMLGI